jgi:hypothetical protein
VTTYEPMDVTIERDPDGRAERPKPPYNPDWSRIDGLRWRAGIIKARTGIKVRFNDDHTASWPGYSYKWPKLIGVMLSGEGWSSSHSEFDSTIDTYLQGLEDGARAMMKEPS